jgi:hypothetical protein
MDSCDKFRSTSSAMDSAGPNPLRPAVWFASPGRCGIRGAHELLVLNAVYRDMAMAFGSASDVDVLQIGACANSFAFRVVGCKVVDGRFQVTDIRVSMCGAVPLRIPPPNGVEFINCTGSEYDPQRGFFSNHSALRLASSSFACSAVK